MHNTETALDMVIMLQNDILVDNDQNKMLLSWLCLMSQQLLTIKHVIPLGRLKKKSHESLMGQSESGLLVCPIFQIE